jgi:hypothetical protein
MSLTINQEKQIRRMRTVADDRKLARVAEPILKVYAELAGKVASYRRAQKLSQSKEAVDLRRALLAEIDALLSELGIRT